MQVEDERRHADQYKEQVGGQAAGLTLLGTFSHDGIPCAHQLQSGT